MCMCNNHYPAEVIGLDDTIQLGVATSEMGRLSGYFMRVRRTDGPGDENFDWAATSPAATRRRRSETAGATASDDFGWDIPAPRDLKGNAVLLAIPAVPGSVTAKNLIPLGECPHLFEDVKAAVVPRRSMSRAPVAFSDAGSKAFIQVVKGFDDGTYDVVISSSAAEIATVLDQVDEDKRPQANVELWRELDIAYEGKFTYLLFCFAEADAEQAGGALVRYETLPEWAHLLHLPALDGHNGRIERGEVELNHTIVVAAPGLNASRGGRRLELQDAAASRITGLPQFVIGKVIPKGTRAPQGDFLFLVKDVAAGNFRAKRQLPPGWSKLPGATAPGAPTFITRSAADEDED